ncbi:MAG: hypothetical protein MHM6MM_006048 [Cercozoa sp. M6MM]
MKAPQEHSGELAGSDVKPAELGEKVEYTGPNFTYVGEAVQRQTIAADIEVTEGNAMPEVSQGNDTGAPSGGEEEEAKAVEVKYELTGEGTFEYKDGSVYIGSVEQGFPCGEGEFTFSDKSGYRGKVKDGLPFEQGVLSVVSPSGDAVQYEGSILNGMPHGEGKM